MRWRRRARPTAQELVVGAGPGLHSRSLSELHNSLLHSILYRGGSSPSILQLMLLSIIAKERSYPSFTGPKPDTSGPVDPTRARWETHPPPLSYQWLLWTVGGHRMWVLS